MRFSKVDRAEGQGRWELTAFFVSSATCPLASNPMTGPVATTKESIQFHPGTAPVPLLTTRKAEEGGDGVVVSLRRVSRLPTHFQPLDSPSLAVLKP